MNLTYYPYAPFPVNTGKVTVFDTGASKIYFDVCRGFTDAVDTVRISNDDLELLSCSSACSWYGDPMLSVDLNKLFLRKVQQRLLGLLTDEQQISLVDKSQDLVTTVTSDSFLLDLPLEVGMMPDLEKVMKFVGLSFPTEITNDPYAILETLIRTHVELGVKKSIVLTNVSHYLTSRQLTDLIQLVHELEATVLVIEFSESNRSEKFKNACYYYVDSDFIDWRSLE